MAEIDVFHEKKDLNLMKKRKPEFLHFLKSYESVSYLYELKEESQHEKFLYDIYVPVLKFAATSSRPFANFTQANNDTLTRLKWRWLASKLDLVNKDPIEESKVV